MGLNSTTKPGAQLTDRERQVLALLSTGRNSTQTAKHMDISPRTVQQYVQSARIKYGAETFAKLMYLHGYSDGYTEGLREAYRDA
ncbi:helix-turn-helix transcriptional regulator [Streptomyces sp. NPDC002855]|uniref:helix-turn-helix transcriptional regulator n=1 Tax=Streptomyces sp. NPDC002855 TaxID=3154437 RepID=UPI003326156D